MDLSNILRTLSAASYVLAALTLAWGFLNSGSSSADGPSGQSDGTIAKAVKGAIYCVIAGSVFLAVDLSGIL